MGEAAALSASGNAPDLNARAHGRTAVRRLTLTDFRSYGHVRLETDARSVVLTGANGAGKTNVLEALSFLVPGRGLRSAGSGEPARQDAGADPVGPGRPWAVAARIDTPAGPVELGSGLVREPGARERRLVRIDGETQRAQAALAEVWSVQWLTPQMDRLFIDGALARRRFLDRLVFGTDPAHAGRVGAYDHALRERARVLKTGTDGKAPDPAWLSALEETMAAKGVAVAAARLEATARLGEICQAPRGPFPGAALSVDGEVEDWLRAGPALAAEDRMRDVLARTRPRDADTGGAAVGPHRSDFRVTHIPKGRPAAQCSTGEQKALLIAIVLANAVSGAAGRGRTPVLLLDEVAAHLDEERRAALFAAIEDLDAQAWMTGTDASLFAALKGRAQFLGVAGGAITALS